MLRQATSPVDFPRRVRRDRTIYKARSSQDPRKISSKNSAVRFDTLSGPGIARQLMATDTSNVDDEAKPAQQQRARRGRPSTKHPQEPGTPKPHKCDMQDCKLSFSRRSDLKRHICTHTGVRNFKCPFEGCGKSFIQTSALTVHKRTHTGEKPHQCKVCDKRFSDSSSLARHRKTHNKGSRPFRCPIISGCGKCFATKSSLRNHIERMHPDKAHRYLNNDSGDVEGSGLLDRGSDDEQTPSSPETDPVDRGESVLSRDGATGFPFAAFLSRRRLMPGGVYYTTQPSTPTTSHWHFTGMQNCQPRVTSMRAHRPHVSSQISQYDSNLYDVGPLTAPIFPSQYPPSSHSYPYTNTAVSSHYNQSYQGHASVASSPIDRESSLPSNHGFHSQMSSYHSQASSMYSQHSQNRANDMCSVTTSLPSTRGSDRQLFSSPTKTVAHQEAARQPEHEMYGIETQYQQPQDVGTVGIAQQYQLPSLSLAFGYQEDEKTEDDLFGELLPSQTL